MLFKSSRKKIDHELRIKIAGHCITQVQHTKFLGTYKSNIDINDSCIFYSLLISIFSLDLFDVISIF